MKNENSALNTTKETYAKNLTELSETNLPYYFSEYLCNIIIEYKIQTKKRNKY